MKTENIIKAELWRCLELTFEAESEINKVGEADLTVVFTQHNTGIIYEIPGFWDGGKTWRVRFAPTLKYTWTFETKSTNNININQSGIIEVEDYAGDLDIYKHGFVRVSNGDRYFTYADGTPFFYLGDTHWSHEWENFDENLKSNDYINDFSTSGVPRFKYCVDTRAAEGFTVYQTQPVSLSEHIQNGITSKIIPYMQELDKRFKYIADKGLVHAHSQLMFPNRLTEDFYKEDFVRPLLRHWVARFGAYPVMWTLGQTVDRQGYKKYGFTEENNPYRLWCEIISEEDKYGHPLSAHQENAIFTGVKGLTTEGNKFNGPSAFLNTKGHNWWAVQWKPEVASTYNINIPKDYYYNSNKPTVNYEGLYNRLGAKDKACRIQAWLSFFNGMCGYGYGCQNNWYRDHKYQLNMQNFDGIEFVNPEDKTINWEQSLKLPASSQLIYMKKFFKSFEWWKLVPNFDTNNKFIKAEKELAVCAYTDKHVIAYFYGSNLEIKSVFTNMGNDPYRCIWFNPINGKYVDAGFVAPINGSLKIASKPLNSDMVLILEKLEGGAL